LEKLTESGGGKGEEEIERRLFALFLSREKKKEKTGRTKREESTVVVIPHLPAIPDRQQWKG